MNGSHVRGGRAGRGLGDPGLARRSGAAVTVSAACTASTGAGPRATSSAGPRAASRSSGVGALLINCLPPEHLDGMLPVAARLHRPAARLLPEPRLLLRGRLAVRRSRRTGRSTRSSPRPGGRRAPRSWAAAAARRRRTSRQPGDRLAGTTPGRPRSRPLARGRERGRACATAFTPAPWRDERGRASTRCPFPEIIREPDVFVPDVRQPARLAAPVGARDRRGQALPRRRLRLRTAGDPARAERRRARACGRHPARRPSRTRSRTRSATASRTASRGAEVDIYTYEPSRALRRRRRQPLPDARRPVRAVHGPPTARLLGTKPRRPLHPAPAPRPGRRRGRLPDAALDHLSAPDRGDPRARPASPPASSTSASSATGRSSTSTPSRSGASRRSPTRTTWISAART